METLIQDLRYAVRQLRRSPGFALVAVLTLALGIGATTAVFSVVNGVLLRPLPYPEADRLYTLLEENPNGGIRPASYPTFQDWQEQSRSFAGLAYVRGDDFVLKGEQGPQMLLAAYASADFFRTLSTPPLLGRTFGETPAGEDRVVVLSHRLWQQRFGGDPAILGRTISTPEASFTVVGVMPPGFQAPIWADVWAPLEALPPGDRYALSERDLHVDSQLFGRLAPGVAEQQAEAEMTGVAQRLAAEYPAEQADWMQVSLSSMPEEVLGDVSSRLLVLAAAVALLLLVACANVASLLLAQASARTRELAIRTALGAGRGRLVRQLLTESVLLGLLGGALGVGVAAGSVHLLRTTMPDVLPRLAEVTVDARVLAFTFAVSLGTALLVGLLPALRAAAPDLVESLKNGTPGAGAGRSTVRVRAALVVAEIALAVVLVVGSGLLIKSLWQLQQVSLGFDPDRLVVVRIFPPAPRYDDSAAAQELYRRLREELAAVPGVEEVALANFLPLAGASVPTRVVTGGEPPAEGEDLAIYRTVSPEYFAAMQTRLIRGRLLGAEDLAGPGGGVVINQALARRFFPDEDPIGQSVTVFKAAQQRPDLGEPITATVVGIVGDERFFGPDADPAPAVFLPYTWNPWGNTYLVARTASNPAPLIPALRRAVLGIDPDIPVAGPGFQTEFHTMDEYLAGRLESRRLNAMLLTAFAGSAFLLAAIGIFGVMAYLVVQRTREFGVRIALGASVGDVVRLVAGQTLRLAAVGIALGLVGALAATRVLRSLLYEVSATDWATYLAVGLLFAAVALLAGYLPAHRAARVDPMVALRAE